MIPTEDCESTGNQDLGDDCETQISHSFNQPRIRYHPLLVFFICVAFPTNPVSLVVGGIRILCALAGNKWAYIMCLDPNAKKPGEPDALAYHFL
jgi:hypothetical protein